jgi:hypothetical protein
MTAAALLAALALAAPGSTRTFSDVCREPQSDDVAGRVVTLTRRPHGWTLGYSATEGAVDEPTPARRLRYDPKTGQLSFIVVTWERISFHGRVETHALIGAISHGEGAATPIRLPEAAPSASYPTCR